ncbi:MAG TPA: TIGR03118 family protein, partial [Chitinophagaceae bacterium]|nr:TIGR03118 family protein [Chitinophagaceae bacterium]
KEGAIVRPAVNIPSPGGATGGNPTGVVFSGSATDFKLSNGQPARFIFVGVDGILSGWNGAAGNNALLIKNNSATSAYTGLTLASNGGANYLYAADFRGGKIAVWDNAFTPVSMPFKDPNLPSGYSPFNIQIVGSWLYVLYAKVGPDGEDQAGAGNGYVSIFTTAGVFVKRFASRGTLNSPWGIAATPAGFFDDMDGDKDDGKSKTIIPESVLLVGNLGDGRINVYSEGGDFIGQLKSHGRTIVIEGLWALSFPPATATTIDPNRLYFTAGPDDEKHGLFGYIIKD